MTRRWAYLVAAVEAACGIAVAAYLVVLGVTAEGADRTALDRAFPFVLAALGLAVLGAMAWRSARSAAPAVPSSPTEPGDRGGFPDDERQRGRHADTPRVTPTLTEEGRAELERILGVLARAGVLTEPVDPDAVATNVADAGEPVTAGSVLGGLDEAGVAHPAVVLHEGHVEQFVETLHEQVDDLARLLGGEPTVRLEHATITEGWRHHLRLRLGDEVRLLEYPGHPKYLSTVLHAAVARAAPGRLAWLWVDQGAWIAAPTVDVDRLNAELGAPDHERWTWVHEEEPVVAG
ncbi:hypothetical protein GCM10023200_21740 [Actinomycetospora chlora]|uniref:Uncharacterized protein n=1 Tax=Actinomycetospora chlora TaxID=663608 RepID=A0ABP9AX53_9PSEU